MASLASLDATELLRLHVRLLDGDIAAGTAIAAALLKVCPSDLLRRWPRIDPALAQDSVERAVLSYLANPRSFDLTKGRLQSFIQRAAERNLIDMLRVEAARRARDAEWAEEWTRHAYGLPSPGGRDSLRVRWPRLMAWRGDLTDHQWARAEPLFLTRAESRGRPPKAVRPMLDGVLWVLRRKGRWRRLPRRYPLYQTCHRHFRDWCESGVLKRALDRLEADLQRAKGSRS